LIGADGGAGSTEGLLAVSKVPVYQYLVLDTNRVELRRARRWGTREAIDRLKDAEILEDSAMVDTSALIGGFTKLDFDPRAE
jgi:hypothetical protein